MTIEIGDRVRVRQNEGIARMFWGHDGTVIDTAFDNVVVVRVEGTVPSRREDGGWLFDTAELELAATTSRSTWS